MATTETEGRKTSKGRTAPIIDTDIHHAFRSLADLGPYLTKGWRERFGIGIAGLNAQGPSAFSLPWVHYTNPHGGMRRDAAPPDGSPAGSDRDFMVKQLFEDHDVTCGILSGGPMISLGAIAHADLATAVAAAFNDWTIAEWLDHDPRFFAGVSIAPQDPAAAAKEIRRVGSHPQMVQVNLPTTRTRLGNRMYFPIYEAAEELGLVVAWHPGGEGAGINGALTAVGPPSSYVEQHASLGQVAQATLLSILCDGVLEAYPDVRVAVLEGGVAWLPHVIWRLDRDWRAVRDELPWLTKPPLEYVHERIRVSSQPLEEPDDGKKLVQLLDTIDGEDILVYASDYPHWDFDNPEVVLRHFSDAAKEKILWKNALAFYPKLTPERIQSLVALSTDGG
jgi:predicted TIM-barrel fold metal-dependent hydrolase